MIRSRAAAPSWRVLFALLPVGFVLAVPAPTPARAESREQRPLETATGLAAGDFQTADEQLRDLVSRVLEGNPEIRSAWARSDASRTRAAQAASLPDPSVSYRYFVEPPETRVGPQEHAIELSQGIPWGGKRRLQGAREEIAAAGLAWEAEDIERRVVADLKRTYYEAAYLQEALRVNAEEKELLGRFESIALRRYGTGQGIQQSVVKVQTEISRLEERRIDLRKRLEVASRRVSSLTGRPDAPLTLLPIDLPFPELAVDGDELERLAVIGHPRVRAAESRASADRAWADRRRLESKPDFRVGVGYTAVGRRDDPAGRSNPPAGNGDDILGVMVGVNIPLYRNRIRSGIAEAQESERASRDLLTAVRDRLSYDVQRGVSELDSLGERGRLYLQVIVPQAEAALASAEAAYANDRMGFLDLLDAERVLFQSRLAYHRLVADLWIAMAEVELATAAPFPPMPHEAANRTGHTR